MRCSSYMYIYVKRWLRVENFCVMGTENAPSKTMTYYIYFYFYFGAFNIG